MAALALADVLFEPVLPDEEPVEEAVAAAADELTDTDVTAFTEIAAPAPEEVLLEELVLLLLEELVVEEAAADVVVEVELELLVEFELEVEVDEEAEEVEVDLLLELELELEEDDDEVVEDEFEFDEPEPDDPALPWMMHSFVSITNPVPSEFDAGANEILQISVAVPEALEKPTVISFARK